MTDIHPTDIVSQWQLGKATGSWLWSYTLL